MLPREQGCDHDSEREANLDRHSGRGREEADREIEAQRKPRWCLGHNLVEVRSTFINAVIPPTVRQCMPSVDLVGDSDFEQIVYPLLLHRDRSGRSDGMH